MKYQYFHFGVFHLLMICSPFRLFVFVDASNFSIVHFLRLLELQFWAFEAPMWLPWLPFAASLACLLRIWNLFAVPFRRWGGGPSKQTRKETSKPTNKQASKHTNKKQTHNTHKQANKKHTNKQNKQTDRQTSKRKRKQRHTHTYIHACMHAYIHTYTYTCAHTRAYMHTYISMVRWQAASHVRSWLLVCDGWQPAGGWRRIWGGFDDSCRILHAG